MAGMAQEHETGLVICVTGPESTGKTTLAIRLAEALAAPLVEEVARSWLTERAIAQAETHPRDAPDAALQRYEYGPADVLEIARAQFDAEAAALRSGAPVVVADTDLTVIRVWWEETLRRARPLDCRRTRTAGATLLPADVARHPLGARSAARIAARSRAAARALPCGARGTGGTARRDRRERADPAAAAFAAVRSWVRDRPVPGPEQPEP